MSKFRYVFFVFLLPMSKWLVVTSKRLFLLLFCILKWINREISYRKIKLMTAWRDLVVFMCRICSLSLPWTGFLNYNILNWISKDDTEHIDHRYRLAKIHVVDLSVLYPDQLKYVYMYVPTYISNTYNLQHRYNDKAFEKSIKTR